MISGHDIPSGATVTALLHSRVVTLGRTTVGSSGSFALGATIPLDTVVGLHHVVVTLSGAGLSSTASRAITVRAPEAAPAVAAALPDSGTQLDTHAYDPPTAETDSTGSKKHSAEQEIEPGIEPNILTRSINPIQDVLAHPQKITAAIAIGLVLLVFATLPARLLNATLSEQYPRLTKRIPRLARRPQWYERFTAWIKRTPVAGGILISSAAALLFGFADPRFGFTLASVRLILGLGVALFIVEYVANAITSRVVRRRWSVNVTLNLRPLGLILTLIGVILSRVLHFSPGFLVGVVLGITLSGRRASQNAWKAVMIRTGVVLGFGLIAWLGYSALTTGEPGKETFWTDLFVETLVAITTEGIVAILVELLPFRLLEGERVFRRSRLLWAVTYLVVLVAFVLAVVPWEGNWEKLGSSLWFWLGVVIAFAVLCLAVYAYFRFLSPNRETPEEEEREPVEVGAGG